MHTNSHIEGFRHRSKKASLKKNETIRLADFTSSILEAANRLRTFGIVDPKLVGASTHNGIVTLSIRHFSVLDDITEAELGGLAIEKTNHGDKAYSYWKLPIGRYCQVTWRKQDILDSHIENP